MVVLAEAGPGDGLDVLQPVPARLQHHPADHEVVEVVDIDAPEQRGTNLVGNLERLRLETGHGMILTPRAGNHGPFARGRVWAMMRHRPPGWGTGPVPLV